MKHLRPLAFLLLIILACPHFTSACPNCPKGKAKGDVEQLLAQAERLQLNGQYTDAVDILRQAQGKAQQAGEANQSIRVRIALGAALTALRRHDEAAAELQAALQATEPGDDKLLLSRVLNNLSILHSARGDHGEAWQAGHRGGRLASEAGDSEMAVTCWLNAARAQLHLPVDGVGGVYTAADEICEKMQALPDSRTKATLLISTARLIERHGGPGQEHIPAMLRQAGEMATRFREPLTASYAYGYLAAALLGGGRLDEALRLTRKAAFYAQQAQSPDATYRWQWQTGRLLREKGDLDAALRAYQNAVASLQSIREDVALGYGNRLDASGFRETAGPMYFELADLLLRKASTTDDPADQRARLLEARNAIELFKNFELADYFQDPCIDTARARQVSVDTVAPKTAVVYLIPLADRTELLVTTAGQLQRFIVEVKGDVLNEEVRLFRRRLQDRTTERYLTQARKIHEWIIAPIEPHLTYAGVETLVFVPDGALRGIPMGALQDPKTKQFLIERYAVAITPGLALMDASPLPRGRVELLVSGLAESRHGLPALQFVPQELEQVQSIFGGTKLLDEQFVAPALKQEVAAEPYTIVHIASHGEFKSDIRDTFLATWDRKLTLDELQQMLWPNLSKNQPLELLALSACQTAAGDDRAALGLAGVAIKSGARSALATLWSINDEASAQVISDFYRNLRDQPALNKAQALRAAQLKLLADDRYQHPCYWSPYLIIGNWL